MHNRRRRPRYENDEQTLITHCLLSSWLILHVSVSVPQEIRIELIRERLIILSHLLVVVKKYGSLMGE